MKKIIALIIVISSCMNCLAQNVGIGTTTPGFPLNFANTVGDKISLYGNTGNHYGFGIQGGLLQIHSDAAAANIAFGWGSSTAFTERMRVINSGADALDLKGRITMRNGTFPVDINYSTGIWMYKADNSGLLGFMGVQNNQNLGFYGGPAGWGFTYDAINSRVGIGTSVPAASAILDVSSTTQGFLPPRMTISQRNAIVNPAIGLVIFCYDCDELQVFNGTIWKNINSFAACSLPGPPYVTICNQVWMNKNLDVATYRNGDPIPKVTDPTAWAALFTGAYCYYNNDSATYAATYGKLYNWYAVNDPRGLAPAGWHVPSDVEMTTLETCLGGASIAGGKMKETGTTHWTTPNTGATNSGGFTGLPGGYRVGSGPFVNVSNYGFWWSATEFGTLAKSCYLYYNDGNFVMASISKGYGFSVRCLRD